MREKRVDPDDWQILLQQYVQRQTNLLEQEKWKEVQREIVARNLFLFNELRRILERFNTAGIEVIILKGAGLVGGVYPHLGLRFFGDIDLLIHRERLSQVIEILSDFGYQPHSPQLRPGAEDFQGAVNYVKQGEIQIMIEPHWTLGLPYLYSDRIDMESMWKRAKKANIAGIDTLVLCPEDLLLHLCLHLFRHHRGPWLTSSCDIAEVIRYYEGRLDWVAFTNRVCEFKICLPVQYSLRKTFELFKPPIPLFVLQQLDRYEPSRFEGWAFALLTTPRDKDAQGTATLARLLLMPGITLRLRYIWTILVPSRDFMLSRCNITKPTFALFYLYYFLRWGRALFIASRTFFRIAFLAKGD